MPLGRHSLNNPIMADKHPKRPRDLNQWAKSMADIATGQVEEREPTPKVPLSKKEAAGIGGKRRAVTLSKKPRSSAFIRRSR
jgi:hypothetical protein